MEKNKPFYKIIDEICREEQIKQKELSYGWIIELTKNNKKRNIIGYQFDLNSSTSYNIASDKFATYEVLNSNNIPTIPHKIIFNPKTRSLYYNQKFLEEAINLLKNNDNKIVIKANNSCEGKDVYYCSNENEIKDVVTKLFKQNDTLSACPYEDIDYEYRAIYLCGDIIFIYKKKKAYVMGDGIHTVKELINEKYNKTHLSICKNLNLNKIPLKNEEVVVSWKHNLNNGAEPILIDDNDKYVEKIKNIAIKAGKAVNIKFASIDIAITSDKKIFVMEINGNVCMNKFTELLPNGYEIAKKVFKSAINRMFE